MAILTALLTDQLIIPALFCYVLTLALMPVSMKLAHFLHAVDMPGDIKIHQHATPRLGGLAIFVSIMISMRLFPSLTHALPLNGRIFIVLSLSGIFLLGVIDDVVNLRPGTKLALQIGCTLIAGTGMAIFYPSTQVAHLIAVCFFLLLFTNSFNLIDGMDGLAGSLAMILAFAIGIIASLTGNCFVLFVSILVASCSTGFLFYNLNPARVFLGDCGSTLIGFTLAISLSMLWLNSAQRYSFIPLIVLAGVPLFDTFLVLVKRKTRHKPLFVGDRNHSYDVLLQKGFTVHQTLAILCVISFVLASLGVTIFLLIT
ncbi:undecaprenyl/decaprenyl-phosphate alpha-N-acetylglucosaminyl 1-phosphate transferase [candidate division KSB1 bacterium]|nr:undecaprenyl/decaprenyl-phosphate alpha-N-acetylglucosaminyl 1-phosphate transferase [candidate division KSB1 bacterium]